MTKQKWYEHLFGIIEDVLKNNFREFEATDEYTESIEALKRICYWNEGKYEIIMTVKTDDPVATFSQKWNLSVKKDQVDALNINPEILMREACNRPKILTEGYILAEFD